MKWLHRLFGRHSSGSPPPEHDFGGAVGKLPLIQPSRIIRLHVTADDRVELEGQAVTLSELEDELASAYQPGAVVYY